MRCNKVFVVIAASTDMVVQLSSIGSSAVFKTKNRMLQTKLHSNLIVRD